MSESSHSAVMSTSPPVASTSVPAPRKGDLQALIVLLFGQKAQLAAVGSISIVAAAASLAQPIVVARAIESVSAGQSFTPMIWLLVALLIASTVLTGIQQYLLQKIGEGVVLDARRRLIRRLFRLHIPEYDRRSVGDFVSRVNSDTTVLRTALIQATISALSGVLTIIGAGVAMALINWQLLVLTILIVAVSLVTVLGLGRLVRNASTQAQEALSSLTTSLERGLRAIRTVRATNSTAQEEDRVEYHALGSWRAGVATAKYISIISPVSGLCTQISLLTVLGVGGYQVSTGRMSIADLVAFMLFLVMLVMPLGQAFGAIGSFGQALGAFGRIKEMLGLPIEDEKVSGLKSLEDPSTNLLSPAIAFENVTFSYESESAPKADIPVLDRVSFQLPRGKRIAIVGPSGAGKSTVFQLIERFYDQTSGSIRIFGHEADSLDRSSIRRVIGYVEQDAPAIGGSLKLNLAMARPDATDAECIAALRQVNLANLLDRSPAGLDSEIGDAGITLSGGERQRLAIARALLSAPPVLLLDESTSSLDGRNEAQMRRAIDSVASGRSLIIIAHRLATVVDSDEIIVLDRGRIVGRGTHEELLASTPLYKDLAEHQLLAS